MLTNLETNETEKLLSFPDGSQFLNGQVFYFRDFRPIFHYDQKQEILYLMFQGENVLYTYDWSGDQPQLVESKDLQLEGFERAEGFESGSIQLGKFSDFKKRPFPSSILHLTSYGPDLLISYAGTPQDKSAIASVVNCEASNETMTRLRNETPTGIMLLRPDGELIPVDFPPMHYGSFKVIGDDIYWMKKPNPEEEAEEFTVYWGKLRIE